MAEAETASKAGVREGVRPKSRDADVYETAGEDKEREASCVKDYISAQSSYRGEAE